ATDARPLRPAYDPAFARGCRAAGARRRGLGVRASPRGRPHVAAHPSAPRQPRRRGLSPRLLSGLGRPARRFAEPKSRNVAPPKEREKQGFVALLRRSLRLDPRGVVP